MEKKNMFLTSRASVKCRFVFIYFPETWRQFHHQQQRDREQKWCPFPGRQTTHHSICVGWNWARHWKSPPDCVMFCWSHHQLHRKGKSMRKYRALIKSSLFSLGYRTELAPFFLRLFFFLFSNWQFLVHGVFHVYFGKSLVWQSWLATPCAYSEIAPNCKKSCTILFVTWMPKESNGRFGNQSKKLISFQHLKLK